MSAPTPVGPGDRRAMPRLVPADALLLVAQLMADGHEEHGDRWTRHPAEHHVDRGLSHALLWLDGGQIDTDSGYSHLVNAAARLLLAASIEHRNAQETR